MGGFPALAIQQPQSPIDQFSKAVQLKEMLGQVQQQQLQIQDQQAATKAMQQWDGKDWNTYSDLLRKNGGSAQAVMGVNQHLLQMEGAAATARKNNAEGAVNELKAQDEVTDHLVGQIDNLKGVPEEQRPQKFEELKQQTVKQYGQKYPQLTNQLGAMQYQGPDQIDTLEKTLMGQSNWTKRQLELANTEKSKNESNLAQLQAQKVKQEIGGFNVDQLNAGLQRRYNVLHPNQPLPTEYTLPQGASPKDFDRTDKLMEAEEKATGTQQQLQVTNALRQQMFDLAQQRQQETKEKQELKWVQWTEPSGRTVATPLSEAKAAGAKDMAELGQKTVDDVLEARNVHQIISKQGNPGRAENMGVMQLIDSLDKDGKLGILSSRMNSFLAGKVGTTPSDDPRITALLNKSDLAMTASMKAHFGASGGRSPQMLEHFLQMANARKMDAGALKSGFAAIDDYMQDRGKIPQSANQNAAAPIKATHRYNPQTGKIEAIP